jgi:hypothetical protein
MKMNSYWQVFDECQDGEHRWSNELHSINGHYDHSKYPETLRPSSGWFDMPSLLTEEEEYRFSMLGHDPRFTEVGYTCYLLPGPLPFGEGGPNVIRFRDPPEDLLSWWPFGGW